MKYHTPFELLYKSKIDNTAIKHKYWDKGMYLSNDDEDLVNKKLPEPKE